MPRFVKFSLYVILLIGLAVAGLYVTGNKHILNAVRSTYFIGRTGPDIDNHRFFENRTVQASAPDPWKESSSLNSYVLNPGDSMMLDSYETTGFLVVQRGEVLFEKYWEEYSDTTWSNSFSMAKSITSMLIGIALQDGLIQSVDEKASKYLKDLQGTDKEEVTIRQLLQMNSGIGFDEHYGDPFGFMAKAYYGDDLYEKTLSYPLIHEPGTYWHYLGGNTLLLSYIVEEVSGKTLSEYASEKLWTPLGAEEDAIWTYDSDSGRERAYCCFYSNARDFARLGQLILCDGNWKGEQLIDPRWIEASMTPSMTPDSSGDPVDYYGYQWWMLQNGGQEVYYMRGILGQYIFVIPETETVVVRLGHLRSEERKDNVPVDVFEFLSLADRILKN